VVCDVRERLRTLLALAAARSRLNSSIDVTVRPNDPGEPASTAAAVVV
jgi:hypothetical protein